MNIFPASQEQELLVFPTAICWLRVHNGHLETLAQRVHVYLALSYVEAEDKLKESIVYGILNNEGCEDMPDVIRYVMMNLDAYIVKLEKGETEYEDQPVKEIIVRDLFDRGN